MWPTHMDAFGGSSRLAADGQAVLFGPSAAGAPLAQEIQELAGRTAVIIASRSVVQDGLVDLAISEGLAGLRVPLVMHDIPIGAPISHVEDIADRCRQFAPDVVVGIGGGSALDTAKAVALTLRRGRGLIDIIERGAAQDAVPEKPPFVVCIPTTLSGAALTSSMGVAAIDGRKQLVRAPDVGARIVCCDSRFLATAPGSLLATTAMTALAHAVEACYSRGANPFSVVLATGATALLASGLRNGPMDDPSDAEKLERLSCGAALSSIALKHSQSGLQHAMCHIVSAHMRIAHSIAHSILLPSVMRFNLAESKAAQDLIAKALGAPPSGIDDPPSRVEELRNIIGAPSAFRSLGWAFDDVAACAPAVMEHPGLAGNPRTVTNPEQIVEICRDAW